MTTRSTPGIKRGRGVSPWAVLSLLFSFGVCPFVTILAIPLGVLGLRDVRRSGRRGRRAAWLGIIISLVMTPLTGWAMAWYNQAIRQPMLHGPRDGIVAGMLGDTSAFNAAFLPADAGSPPEVAEFAADLRSRWGMLQDVEIDASRVSPATSLFDPIRVPYVFRFEVGTVPGEAEFIVFQKTSSGTRLVGRFAWVLVGTGQGDVPPVSWPVEAAKVDRLPLLPREEEESDTEPR